MGYDRARNQPPLDCWSMGIADGRYPRELAGISDPPQLLWVRGRLDVLPRVAIVGSRNCSAYGRRVASGLAAELASRGVAIVSGLARGIDAAAHRGALEVDGATIAVLPGGIVPVYPARHRALAERIVRRGALVAEDDPGTRPAPWMFPRRNRIIAGLTQVTVVAEAAARSGARITADLALDYGREVLAVPGPITSPTSVGCNALLAQGAAPCTGPEDVLALLDELVVAGAPPRRIPVDGLGGHAARLLELLLGAGDDTVERLAERLDYGPAEILAALTELELRGLVEISAGGLVALVEPCTTGRSG